MARQTEHSLTRPTFEEAPRLAFVVAPFYREITDQLTAGAQAEVEAAGGSVEIIEVPGALEVPAAIRLAWNGGEFDGFVALGCVVRGETYHYETVCNESARGIMQLTLQGAAIGNGILTVETLDQARVRADPDDQSAEGQTQVGAR